MRALLLVALAWVVVGCGGQVSTEASDGGTDAPGPSPTSTPTSSPTTTPTTTPPSPGPGASPPVRPSMGASGGTTEWFAITKFQLGLTRKDTGATDANAWKDYGYDLDGRTTTAEDSKTSTNSCKRVVGSPTKVLMDGSEGRDNNFGQHLMSVMKSLKSDVEESVNASVATSATLLLRLDNVGSPNNANVPGSLYLAMNKGSCGGGWSIDTRSLDASKNPKVQFKGYMSGGVWVSGELGSGAFDLPLPWSGSLLSLHLESGVISFTPGESFTPGASRAGTIAGGVSTSNLKAAFTPFFATFGVCPGFATFDQVIDTMAMSADLVSGAPQLQDTSRECDAVSVGLGFVVEKIAAPTCLSTGTTPPSGC